MGGWGGGGGGGNPAPPHPFILQNCVRWSIEGKDGACWRNAITVSAEYDESVGYCLGWQYYTQPAD